MGHHGAKVCIADTDARAGHATIKEFAAQLKGKTENVMFLKCDVTKESELAAIFEQTKSRYGSIDIVCNNAGIVNENDWKTCIDVNLNSVISGSRLAVEHMSATSGGNGGTIINIASLAGLMMFPLCPVYCATKHAVLGYTRSIAMSLPPEQNQGKRSLPWIHNHGHIETIRKRGARCCKINQICRHARRTAGRYCGKSIHGID